MRTRPVGLLRALKCTGKCKGLWGVRLLLRRLVLVFVCLVALPLPSAWATHRDLVLGIHPYLTATELHQRFLPLAEFLGAELGRTVVISIAKDYDEHIERVGKGEVDIAFLGPASYVTLVKRYGEQPVLAGIKVGGKRTFRGVLIVREESSLKSLSQLKGHSFAFGDPNSTMSYLVPAAMLARAGVAVSSLSSYKHLKNHDNVALGVLMGDFDAGAIKEEVFEKYKARGLRALEYTPEVADHIFVARKGLPEDLVVKLRALLLSGKLAPGVLGSIHHGMSALVPADNSEYKSLRSLMDELERQGLHDVRK